MTMKDNGMVIICRRTCDAMVWQWTGKALFEGHTFLLPTISGASVLRTPGSRFVAGTN
jgi:hypothetical protein